MLDQSSRRSRISLAALLSPALAFAAYGCSALLDTGSLQGGGEAGAGGTQTDGGGGSGGSAGSAGGDASDDGDGALGKACTGDFDCDDGDPCTVDKCEAGHCAAPSAFTGAAIAASTKSPDVQTIITADDIGIPVIAADDQDIVVAALTTTIVGDASYATDIVVERYPNDAALGGTQAKLGTVFAAGNAPFEYFTASPGLLFESLPRRLRTLVSGHPTGPANPGLWEFDIDISGNIKLTLAQPPQHEISGPIHDGESHSTHPYLYTAAGKETAMWLSGGKLWSYGTAATQELGGQTVTGFAPVPAISGLHAVVALDDGTTETTQVWSKGGTGFTQLPGDAPGNRLGISVATIDQGALSLSPLSLVAWGFPSGTAPTLGYAGVTCTQPDSCTTVNIPSGVATPTVGYFPTASAGKTPGSINEADVLTGYLTSFPDAKDANLVDTVFVLSGFHVTVTSSTPSAQQMNPASLAVSAGALPKGAKVPALFEAAIALTPTRQLMAAWVERDVKGKASLKTKRYEIKQCP